MATLLLRLAGPMQSWGIDSKLTVRNAGREPSKSGVIGLVAAALGRSRDDSIDDLVSLRFGVRVDQTGTLLRDYHTAHHPTNDKRSYVTERYYISDAVFVAGLEGGRNILEDIEIALHNPYYPLFLGRRSCPVTGQLSLGIQEAPLGQALKDCPWQAAEWYKRKYHHIQESEITMDSMNPLDQLIRDVPVSFSHSRRSHTSRTVVRERHVLRNNFCQERSTDHDVFGAMREA